MQAFHVELLVKIADNPEVVMASLCEAECPEDAANDAKRQLLSQIRDGLGVQFLGILAWPVERVPLDNQRRPGVDLGLLPMRGE